MSNIRRLELICGIMTGCYALGYIVLMIFGSDGSVPVAVFFGLLLNELPALLAAVGAYVHTVKNKSGGRIMIWIGAILSAIGITLSVLGGLIGYYGITFVLYFLAPYLMSIVTAAVTFGVVQSERKKRAAN